MSEIEQLKKRIEDSGMDGIETARVRDDYEPVGDLMIRQLIDTGNYVTRQAPTHSFDAKWRIFSSGYAPY